MQAVHPEQLGPGLHKQVFGLSWREAAGASGLWEPDLLAVWRALASQDGGNRQTHVGQHCACG